MLRRHLAFVLLGLLSLAGSRRAAGASADWREYLGGPDRSHYSTLIQLTTGNVGQLRKVWEYHTGDLGEMQCNPIVVDGILYGVTAANGVFALDAATGEQRWRFTPKGEKSNHVLRGLTYWQVGEDRRILFTLDSWLCAVDAHSGQLIDTFGVGGKTSLKAGLGDEARDKWVVSTTPGTLWDNLLLMPTRVTEGPDAAPGFIQAFNVRTGRLAWTFHTIPRPGEPGYDTWSKDSYMNLNVGSANCWAGMTVDLARGIAYVPTGSASPDFWGGDRRGRNLYANCLLALEARTGRLLWYYQFVHHDLWDRDLPAPPNLITVVCDGRKIDAVAQVTKSGHVFVFDRESGKPLFPIQEIPVAKSELEGEEASPTQPVPQRPAPFARQNLTENDLSPYAENYDELLAKFRQARHGAFQPFGKYDTVVFPGFDGGAEWGGAAVDPDGILYVNANEIAWIARLKDTPKHDELAQLSPGNRLYMSLCLGCHGADRKGNPTSNFPSLVDLGNRRNREEIAKLISTGKGMMPGFPMLSYTDKQLLVDNLFGAEKVEGDSGTLAPAQEIAKAYAPFQLNGYVKFLDSQGYPAIRPPWGSLTAINLNSGKQVWRISLGEFKELTAKGIPPTGTENYGGPIVTAGGLLFIAATRDGMFRAFDKKTGELLWETELPAGGFATPCTYEVAGKQYVAVACGGTKLGTKQGDSYVAFALPWNGPIKH
jgi:quinoprotein glucose dehydrogenase